MDNLEWRRITSLNGIDSKAWNLLVEEDNPFMRYEFLSALEETACIGKNTTWQVNAFAAFQNDTLCAVAPAFVRYDSYGEYIFDWAWANAYHNAGLSYYPKLTVAAPFTPATGRRILTGSHNLVSIASAVHALKNFSKNTVSGIHFLCTTRAEQRALSQLGFAPRVTHQYHWHNRQYKSFDDYLSHLHSHRRKEIKRERKKCSEHNLRIETFAGEAIREEHIRAMYVFYCNTYARKWGSPYLNERTFFLLWKNMTQSLVLNLAHDGKSWVAGALAFYTPNKIFGRYWGAVNNYPYLHFELCLYRFIEFAIRKNIATFDAGAQGEHKFQRGFMPTPIYSSHLLFHTQAFDMISAFLSQERHETIQLLKASRQSSAFRH
ncbi:MAG TPA: GNAT family N-acetyltransferase [Turneriella sp.]|nr:GNAT family N-acetyltransferase [Turneriella sp.]